MEEGRLGFDGVWRLEPKSGDNQGFFVARLRKPATQEQGPASRPLPPGQPPRFELDVYKRQNVARRFCTCRIPV